MTLARGTMLASADGLLVRVVRVRGETVEVEGRSETGCAFRVVLDAARLLAGDSLIEWAVVE